MIPRSGFSLCFLTAGSSRNIILQSDPFNLTMECVDDVKSVADLERKLSEIQIPWEEIAPTNIHE